jgi:hypothetical protein
MEPETGVWDWQLATCHYTTEQIKIDYVLHTLTYSFPMIGTVQLSSWMGKLFRPMGPGYRLQIKARAAAQKREMTKKSVHKVTQKPQVYFGGSLTKKN